MILFFHAQGNLFIAVSAKEPLSQENINKLVWLFSEAEKIENETVIGWFVGPRKEMITPWSTNAVEITQNMGISGIDRIEEYIQVEKKDTKFDPMLQHLYSNLDQTIFTTDRLPDPIINVVDIAAYNQKEGLALSTEEIEYLDSVALLLNRPLTDSEVFGFSQVNSEHCRHKIFNGTFIIDGIVHYCVANMPGAVPYTSTLALTNSTLPYAIQLANKGWKKACQDNKELALGLNVIKGDIVYEAVSQAWGMPYKKVTSFL